MRKRNFFDILHVAQSALIIDDARQVLFTDTDSYRVMKYYVNGKDVMHSSHGINDNDYSSVNNFVLESLKKFDISIPEFITAINVEIDLCNENYKETTKRLRMLSEQLSQMLDNCDKTENEVNEMVIELRKVSKAIYREYVSQLGLKQLRSTLYSKGLLKK